MNFDRPILFSLLSRHAHTPIRFFLRRHSHTPIRRYVFSPSFTLIEMMVVMGIIVLLATLLFPAVIRFRERAKRRQALVEACNIAVAVKMFRAEHGKWPNQTQGATDTTYFVNNYEIINRLRIPGSNERHKIYLPLQTNSLDRFGNYVDPWGLPYTICMDENSDKELFNTDSISEIVYSNQFTGEISTNSMSISNATRSGVVAISIWKVDETIASWSEID